MICLIGALRVGRRLTIYCASSKGQAFERSAASRSAGDRSRCGSGAAGKGRQSRGIRRADPRNPCGSRQRRQIATLCPSVGAGCPAGRDAIVSANDWQAKDGWAESLKPDLTLERKPLDPRGQPFTVEDGAGIFKRTVNESAKMSTGELQNYIRQLRSIGASTIEPRLDLLKRLAFPFSCLTLGVLALPFALTRRARRYSPLLSIAVSIGIGLVFWLLMTNLNP